MIHVIVKHYLSKEGKEYFAEWIEEVKKRTSTFEGFVSTQEGYLLGSDRASVIVLEWENEESLRIWRSSKGHEEILDMLHPYQVGGSEAQFFEW